MEQREHQQTHEQTKQQENTSQSFEIITNPKQRESLVWCADRLIEKIVAEKFNCLIFLDQSARPVSWLLRDRFEKLKNTKQGIFADENNSATMFPEVKFINFGPEDKNEVIDDNRKQDMAPQLKKIFQKADGSKTYLDNKKVLIIDEYSPGCYYGDKELSTVSAARQVFTEAFASQNAQFFSMVFIPKEEHALFLKTGGVPWRDPSDISRHNGSFRKAEERTIFKQSVYAGISFNTRGFATSYIRSA